MNRQPKNNNPNEILAYLLAIIIALVVLCLLASLVLLIVKLALPAQTPQDTQTEETTTQADAAVSLTPEDVILAQTADAGMEYIEKMIFFGESTTAHLSRSGGVLDTDENRRQVWNNASNTRKLDSRLATQTFYYYNADGTREEVDLPTAVTREQPEYMVLSFGLNGIIGFIGNKTMYLNAYRNLINEIRKASPDTKIILQSVYPVCRADNYSVNVETLNEYIRTLNEWILELAASCENVRYADTASVLTDGNGMLKSQYDSSGDGIHLTNAAYQEILYYLRTHAWQ